MLLSVVHLPTKHLFTFIHLTSNWKAARYRSIGYFRQKLIAAEIKKIVMSISFDTYYILNETPFSVCCFCNILWFMGATLPLKFINYRSINKCIRTCFHAANHDVLMQSPFFVQTISNFPIYYLLHSRYSK